MSEQTKPEQPVERPADSTTQLPAPQQESPIAMSSAKEAWELAQRKAKAYSRSSMVPKAYQNDPGVSNCIIALNLAHRLGVDELMVMQNLHIVQGRPAWSSSFLIASINQSGKFSSLRYDVDGEPGKDGYRVRAWAYEAATGERLDGTWITWDMVKVEGWLDKPGSKWKTMPEQMLMYRAAAFLCRAYAAEISLGIMTSEEAEDVTGGSVAAGHNLPNVAVSAGSATGNVTAGKVEEVSAVAEVIELQSVLPNEAIQEVAEVVSEVTAETIIETAVTETVVSETPAEVASPSPAVTTVQMLEPPTSTTTQEAPISKDTLENLAPLLSGISPPKSQEAQRKAWLDTFKRSLQNKFGAHATSIQLLTEEQGQQMIKWATKQVEKKRLESWATGQTQPDPAKETGDNSPPFQ